MLASVRRRGSALGRRMVAVGLTAVSFLSIPYASPAQSPDVDEATLAARRARWQAPRPRYRNGVMAKYAALVSSASEGAVTNPRS